jgi:hypothetical protein
MSNLKYSWKYGKTNIKNITMFILEKIIFVSGKTNGNLIFGWECPVIK